MSATPHNTRTASPHLGEAVPGASTWPGARSTPSGGHRGPVQAAPATAPATEEEPAPPARHRGPGRNLPAAITVGVLLGGAVLAVLFLLPKAVFAAVVAIVLVIGVLEVVRALGRGDVKVPALPVLVGVVGMVISTVVFGVEGLVAATAAAVCVVILWRVSESLGLIALRDVAGGVFTIAWVPFLGCFTLLLLAQEQGQLLVLLAVLVPVANDTGGYVAGVLFGSHPMAPSISPKKSWEGFAGSLLAGIAASTALLVWALGEPWWVGVILGAALVVLSTCGDLAESLLKRDLGIKDMGHLLPGHGGMLDRIDSILLAAPTTFILLEFLLP